MSNTGKRTPVVLTADDDPVTSAILQAYLECEGYEILSAADGDGAIALARETPPDAVILDYNIPPTNGADVARALRSDPATRYAGIALLTASAESAGSDEDDLWNARLTKPVEQEFLARIVASLVEGARTQAIRGDHQEPNAPLPDDPIQAQFVARLREKAAEMRRLARCESDANSPGSSLRVLRRHLQQLEGSAVMCGFPDIGEQAAEAEFVLEQCLQDIKAGVSSDKLDTVRTIIERIAASAKRGGRDDLTSGS